MGREPKDLMHELLEAVLWWACKLLSKEGNLANAGCVPLFCMCFSFLSPLNFCSSCHGYLHAWGRKVRMHLLTLVANLVAPTAQLAGQTYRWNKKSKYHHLFQKDQKPVQASSQQQDALSNRSPALLNHMVLTLWRCHQTKNARTRRFSDAGEPWVNQFICLRLNN